MLYPIFEEPSGGPTRTLEKAPAEWRLKTTQGTSTIFLTFVPPAGPALCSDISDFSPATDHFALKVRLHTSTMRRRSSAGVVASPSINVRSRLAGSLPGPSISAREPDAPEYFCKAIWPFLLISQLA